MEGKKRNFLKIVIFLSIFLCFIIGPQSLAFGQQPRLLQLDWPPSPVPGGADLDANCRDYGSTTCNFALVVRYFYEWGIVLGGLAAFFALLIAGLKYISSFGNPAAIKDAKDRITSVFLGLAILLGSWVILNTISSQLTVLTPPGFQPPPVSVPPTPPSPPTVERKNCDLAIINREPGGELELLPNQCTNITPIIGTNTHLSTKGYTRIKPYRPRGEGRDEKIKVYQAVEDALLGYIETRRGERYVECRIASFLECQRIINGRTEEATQNYQNALSGNLPPAQVENANRTFRYAMEGLRDAYGRLCCVNCSGDIRFYGTSQPNLCEGLSQIVGIGLEDFRDLRFDVYNVMLFVGKWVNGLELEVTQ